MQLFAIEDSSWYSIGSGTNSTVYSLAADNFGNIYAGGTFTSAGGSPASKIAKWNGTNWFPLGNGLNGTVYSLFVAKDGTLYAGGDFTYSGSTTLNRIAKWNGSTWSALDAGMNYTVYAITEDKAGNIYAGGLFTTAGGVPANYVAKWNGTTWSALGEGTNSAVFTLASDAQGNIFAGGAFTFAGGVSAQRIAKWDGASWSALAAGLNEQVNHICFDNSGNLFACGAFTYAGSIPAARIAKWDGSKWENLKNGLTDKAFTVSADTIGNIFVGGLFLYADTTSARKIAQWNGSEWSALGSGISGFMASPVVYATIVSPDGDLYVGGEFTTAGTTNASYIAKCAIPKKITFETDGTIGAELSGQTVQVVNVGADTSPVTAIAPQGHDFINWTENGIGFSTENPLIVKNVTRNLTLVANFTGKTYTVKFQTDGTAGAYIDGSILQTVKFGNDCSPVTAIPPTGYSFVKWTFNGTDYSSDNPLTVKNVSQDMTLIAVFSAENYKIEFKTDGTEGASLLGETTQNIPHGGNCTPVTAVPPQHYKFKNWTLNDKEYSSENPITVQNVTQSMTLIANFTVETFKLTYIAGFHGAVKLEGEDETYLIIQTIEYGKSGQAVYAIPAEGYYFIDWSDGKTDNPRIDANVTSALTVTANFAINTYTLTYTADEHGFVKLEGGEESQTVTQTVEHGGTGQAVYAVPADGYHFVDWSDGKAENPRIDANVTSALTVTANFAINTYTLTYTAGEHGSVNLEGGEESQTVTQTVEHGGTGQAVYAVPVDGYHFVDWSDGSTDNPRIDANVTSDLNLTANFAINVYTVKFETDGTPGAELSGETIQTIQHGKDCSPVSVSIPDSYYFTRWTDNNGKNISIANPFTAKNINSDITFIANFTEISAGKFVVFFFVEDIRGKIEGEVIQIVSPGNSTSQVTAMPNIAYNFAGWLKGEEVISTEPQLVIQNVNENMTIVADMPIKTFTLNYIAGEHGAVKLEDGEESQTVVQKVEYGSSGKAVFAVPAEGYHFVDWSDGKTDNPRIDANITSDLTVTANFAINTYTLTYIAGEHGLVKLEDGKETQTVIQKVEYGETGKPVFAIPTEGYHFIDWSDGKTENPRIDSNISGDLTVTANFAKNVYTLTYTADEHGSVLQQGGEISQTVTQNVEFGGNGDPVLAIPSPGYSFSSWSDGRTDNPRIDMNVSGNINVLANFTLAVYTVTYTAGDNGTLQLLEDKIFIKRQKSITQQVEYGKDATPVQAIPDDEYMLDYWELDEIKYLQEDILYVKNVVTNLNFIAKFKKRPDYLYQVEFIPGENGFINGQKLQILEVGSNTFPVEAIPNDDGFYFNGWKREEKLIFSDNPLIIKNLQKDMILEAEFLPKPAGAFSILFKAGENGSLEGNLSQCLLPEQTGTSVMGKPNPGFFLECWLLDNTEFSRVNPLVVSNPTSKMELQAKFSEAIQMTIKKILVKSSRVESKKGTRDKYSFSFKAILPENFDWAQGDNTQIYISLGKYFNFAGVISSATKKKYDLANLANGGYANFITYDTANPRKKTRSIAVNWNKKKELSVNITGTPAFDTLENLMNLMRVKTDIKGKISEKVDFDCYVVFGNASSGLNTLNVTGVRTYKFDKSSNVYYSWNARATLPIQTPSK